MQKSLNTFRSDVLVLLPNETHDPWVLQPNSSVTDSFLYEHQKWFFLNRLKSKRKYKQVFMRALGYFFRLMILAAIEDDRFYWKFLFIFYFSVGHIEFVRWNSQWPDIVKCEHRTANRQDHFHKKNAQVLPTSLSTIPSISRFIMHFYYSLHVFFLLLLTYYLSFSSVSDLMIVFVRMASWHQWDERCNKKGSKCWTIKISDQVIQLKYFFEFELLFCLLSCVFQNNTTEHCKSPS